MSQSDTIEAYLRWLHKKQPHLETYYKQLFSKYPWLKPAISKTRRKNPSHPLNIIRPTTLHILCQLVEKMSKEGIFIGKTDLPILMQLIMRWMPCSKRTALDYAMTLIRLSITNRCLL